MKKLPIILILLVLGFNFLTINYTLFLNFTQYKIDFFSVLLYCVILLFIIMLIYFVITRNVKTPIYLSYYFILCLITTIAEIIYLSSNGMGTKINIAYFLIYFSFFIYVTKSHYIKKYFGYEISKGS
ncbi:hypothetical protein A9G12_10630 [Gilliamella sp. wkB112]|nr:hypothetical protein A9G12_10630 [Gilliamella apicola]